MSTNIYFEAQDDAFQLCGQHALNNLLQGAYFTAFDLGDIGAKLDEQEQMLYNDFTKSIRKQSLYRNVSLSGSFSIDVLIAALNQINLHALSLSHPQCSSVQQHPETENGFIINYNGHWMSYRKLNNIWYNLNSITNYKFIQAQPVQISEIYLTTTLSKLYKNGYQIFVIRGQLPLDNSNASKMEELKNDYKYYKSEDIKTHSILYKLSQEKIEIYNEKQMLIALNKQKEFENNNYKFEKGFHIKWNIKPIETRDINKILHFQQYKCATCTNRLVSNFLSKTSYYLCEYLGTMHCRQCHKKDKAIIPSQVLNNLNYKTLNVCINTKEFLDKMYFIPCITIHMFNYNNKKIIKSKKLKKLKTILYELKGIKKCMCDENKLLNKSYIYDGLLSLNDIVNILTLNTLNKMEIFVNKLKIHIVKQCNICKLKGDICKICKDKNNRIYPFMCDKIISCNKCMNKYHQKCWNLKNNCVKCM
eukprot:48453_1